MRLKPSVSPRCISLILLTAVIVSTVPAVPAQERPGNPAREAHPRTRQPGIPNFSEVTSLLYRGAQPNDKGFQTLAKMGINIVVDFRGAGDHERKEVERLGMKYVAIPWHCNSPKDELFARFIELLRENPEKKVFVHCRLGDDRTGMMIAAYRMSEQGWSAEEAMKDMRTHGYSTFHHMLCPKLASYEAGFPKVIKTSPAFEKLRTPQSTLPEK
jgi:tyrosine-protein phosphatase SIW14